MHLDFNIKHPRVILLLILITLFFLEDALLIANSMRRDKPIWGLKVFGKQVASLSRNELKQFITSEFATPPHPLVLAFGDLKFSLTRDDLSARIDPGRAVTKIMRVGREGNWFVRILDQNQAFLGLYDKKLRATSLDKETLKNVISRLALVINQESLSPQPDFVHDLTQTTPGVPGRRVDVGALSELIADHILDPPGHELTIPVASVTPHPDEQGLNAIRKQVPNLVQEPIQFSSAHQIFTLSRNDLLALLTVKERPDPKNPKKTLLVLRLNEGALNRKLGEFAQKVEAITHAEFDYHDARVAIYAQFYSGTRNLLEIPTGSSPASPPPISESPPRTSSEFASIGVASTQGNSSSTPEKFVYLTFDDGPNNVYHPWVLDILKQYHIKATFFLVGQNSQKFDSITERTKREGHFIGNHSLTHAFLPKLSPAEALTEIQSTDKILKPFNDNKAIVLFRPPYGGVNKNVRQDAKDLHLKLTLWDVDPRDWSEPAPDELMHRVVDNVHSGSDILLHSNHLSTVKALPQIIEELQKRGYAFRLLGQ